MKHNKLKNTGIIFEILCKKIMHETLNPTLPQAAMRIVRRHFTADSKLMTELKLYQQLQDITTIDTAELLGLVTESRMRISSKELQTEKYQLIKSIKAKYKLDEFFDSRVGNYKLLASIYNLFEHSPLIDPTKYIQNKQFIIESLTPNNTVTEIDETEQELLSEDADVRKLGFKFIVEKFNDKYRDLNPRQKKLLSKYINEDSTTTDFKDYVIKECGWIGKQMDGKVSQLPDSVLKIKLTEVNKLLNHIVVSDKIKEDHLSSMLKYYELLEEL